MGKLSFWTNKPFEQSIMEALEQLKKEGYVEKLKTCITQESIPSDTGDLIVFLYDLIKHI